MGKLGRPQLPGRNMIVGIPTEIKDGETRVGMLPSLCRRCVELGSAVVIQRGAGEAVGFDDSAN